MSEDFKVEIVNPEKSFLLKEDVTEVVIPAFEGEMGILKDHISICLLYTSPSPRDGLLSRMPSSA